MKIALSTIAENFIGHFIAAVLALLVAGISANIGVWYSFGSRLARIEAILETQQRASNQNQTLAQNATRD